MKDLIQNKLNAYKCNTKEDKENTIAEITQEIALYGFHQSGFFEKASFQGGTCLRIIYGLDRFSEDLDFCLDVPDPDFDLSPYLKCVSDTMKNYGYNIAVSGADKAGSNVQKRFIKDDSIKKILHFSHATDLNKKIKIKVELDINPPENARMEQKYLDFPVDFVLKCHDPGSLFAGKSHALLCREWVKGRDWYDFSWYCAHQYSPNLKMLSSALNQLGPWSGKKLEIDLNWFTEALANRIKSIDWEEARKDVIRFVRPERRSSLDIWSEDFFLSKLKKLGLMQKSGHRP